MKALVCNGPGISSTALLFCPDALTPGHPHAETAFEEQLP